MSSGRSPASTASSTMSSASTSSLLSSSSAAAAAAAATAVVMAGMSGILPPPAHHANSHLHPPHYVNHHPAHAHSHHHHHHLPPPPSHHHLHHQPQHPQQQQQHHHNLHLHNNPQHQQPQQSHSQSPSPAQQQEQQSGSRDSGHDGGEGVPSLAHIPLKSYMIKDFPFNINCKGCNKAFPCYYTPKGFKKIPAPAYYVHCIDDCPEYRAKGQIKECEVCCFKFLDKQSLGIHKNSCRSTNKRAMLAKKPKWMPYSILLTIINYSKFDGRIDCRGCKRKFPCYRNGTKVVPSLEYYIHCIEECKEYRDKGWIQKCSQCKCKFLNTISLIQHMKGCFK